MGSQAAKHKILFRGEVAEERARRDQAFGTQVLEAHRFVAVGEEPVKRRRLDYEKYDIDKHDDGSVLISTVLTERFTGAIEGTGRADHIRLVHTDGTGISTGIERIEGSVDGRAGSFVLTAHGRNHGRDRVTGTWTVQPGSGTADGRWRADDEFVYWFES
jgi:hypothetical protein